MYMIFISLNCNVKRMEKINLVSCRWFSTKCFFSEFLWLKIGRGGLKLSQIYVSTIHWIVSDKILPSLYLSIAFPCTLKLWVKFKENSFDENRYKLFTKMFLDICARGTWPWWCVVLKIHESLWWQINYNAKVYRNWIDYVFWI